MVGRICGTGAYAPPVFVSNEDLENVVDTSDTWIRERTGIARRHIAVEDTAVTMAVEAARQALADGEIDPEAVEPVSYTHLDVYKRQEYCYERMQEMENE